MNTSQKAPKYNLQITNKFQFPKKNKQKAERSHAAKQVNSNFQNSIPNAPESNRFEFEKFGFGFYLCFVI
jgi:hypothetical protein